MSSNYNMRGNVPIAFVKGKKFDLSRIRQTFDDLVKDERIPAFLN